MPRIVPLKPKEVERLLFKHGFIHNHSVGSHRQYYHPKTKAHVTIPFHSRELAMGTLRSIIKQSQLPVSLFRR